MGHFPPAMLDCRRIDPTRLVLIPFLYKPRSNILHRSVRVLSVAPSEARWWYPQTYSPGVMVWCPRGKVSVGICITCLCIDTHVSCIHTLCIYVYNEHICTYMSFLYSCISMFQASNFWGYRRISSGYIYIYIYMWRFPKIGVPPVLIHFIFGFSMK